MSPRVTAEPATSARRLADPELGAALDALDAAGLIMLCPGCRTNGAGNRRGHRTLCEACSYAELGLTAEQNSRRIELGWSMKRWRAWEGDDMPPPPYANATRRRMGLK